VRQWLGVVISIAIALLLTLPLPLPYCVPSCCLQSVQLHFALCNVACRTTALVAALRVVPWHFYAMQRDAMAMLLGPRQCVLFCSIVRHAMVWFFVLPPCASCCSIFMPWHYASCHSILQVLRHFASCSGNALCAAYWKWHCVSSNSACAIEFCQKKRNNQAAAMCFVLQHCASCHSMVLCVAALRFMLQHFCATALCFMPQHFAGVEAFCFMQQHCTSCCSILEVALCIE